MGWMTWVSALSLASLVARPEPQTGLRRKYVLDCGRLTARDQSRWTPGVQVGQPRELSNSCYLLQHARGTLLWETGVPDSVAGHPAGVTSPNGAVVWFRDRTLRDQLADLGVKLADLTYVAVSHSHGDHVGNLRAFTRSKLLVQAAEHDALVGSAVSDEHMVERLAGDRDVFGDGSVTILSTPGHTPGHQSLLVRLPRTGALLLTGDVVHFQYMWDRKVVPPFNHDRTQSLASINRLSAWLQQHRAQLWIGHDKDHAATVRRAPAFYE